MKLRSAPRLRCVAALLLGVTALPLFASKEVPVVGLTIDSFDTLRWQRDRDTFVSGVQKQGGQVLVRSANSQDSVQLATIKSFVDRHVDVIVIVAHNAAALGDAIKSANAAHIPVIAYDRMIPNADLAAFVGFDNEKVGELQGAYVVEHLPADHKARIVRLLGSQTDPNATLFKNGQDKALAPAISAGKAEIVFEDWVENWSADNAAKLMKQALTKAGGPIDAVLASNDGIAGAAIDVITAAHAGHPIVTGQDAERSACARIMDGTQSMTVYKPLEKLATIAANVAVGLARGTPPAASTTLNNGAKDVPAYVDEVVSVDKSNLGKILAAGDMVK